MNITPRIPRIITIIAATGSLAISACASDPAADAEQRQILSEHFVPVQAHQTADLTLSCQELAAGIAEMGHAISVLDKQISYQQQSSNSFSFISASASAEGSLGKAGAPIEANQSASNKDLRGMYQYRHDTLMQLFYGENCGA
jgi:hypothetical protein